MKYKSIKLLLITTTLAWIFPSVEAYSAVITQDGRYKITGVSEQKVTSFNGIGQSININLGSEILRSGEINFSLDQSKNNRLIYDFELGKLTIDVHLLLDAPILKNLGESSIKFNLIETAKIPTFNILNVSTSNPNTIIFDYQSDGNITQPLLEPQSIISTGSGLLAPGDDSFTIAITEPLPNGILFTGGGNITSGTFKGFGFFNSNAARVRTFPIDVPKEPPIQPLPETPEGIKIIEIKVPEPINILGLVTGLGFGTFFKQKLNKKQKKQKIVITDN